MTAGTRHGRGGFNHRPELGDFHPEFLRALRQVFPGKRVRPLRGKLVAQRHRIVVIQDYKMVADREVQPGADDEAVFYGTGNRADIHDFVGVQDRLNLHDLFIGWIEVWVARSCRRRFRLGKGEQHRKLGNSLHGVRQVGRQVQQITGLQQARLARQRKLALARKNLNQGVLGGCVFRQFLAGGKAKQNRAGVGRAQERPADNAVRRKPGFVRQRHDRRSPGFHDRLLIHATSLPKASTARLDGGQGFGELAETG